MHALALLYFAIVSQPGVPQVSTVRDDLSCTGCDVVLDLVALFDPAEVPGLVTAEPVVVRWFEAFAVLKRRRTQSLCLVLPGSRQCEAVPFATEAGRLPAFHDLVVSASEELLVLDGNDSSLYRVANSGAATRHLQLPVAATKVVAMTSDYYMAHAISHSPELAGLPLHIVDRNGTRRHSLDADSAIVDPLRPFLSERVIGAAPFGRAWAAQANVYDLRRFDSSGRLDRQIRRESVDYVPWDRQKPGEPWFAKPSWQVRALVEDSLSRLWVVLSVPDSEWQARVAPLPLEVGLDAVSAESLLDSIVEVIDLNTGTLLARKRVPWIISGFASQREVFGLRSTPDGVRAGVWSFQLQKTTAVQQGRRS